MTDGEKVIGQNLARIRGDMSQAALAELMRGHGHKWSQSTVWNVERGERPLRLREAGDLAQIMGTPLAGLLIAPGHRGGLHDVETAERTAGRAWEVAADALARLIEARQGARHELGALAGREDHPPEVWAALEQVEARLDAHDYAAALTAAAARFRPLTEDMAALAAHLTGLTPVEGWTEPDLVRESVLEDFSDDPGQGDTRG